MKPPPPPMQIQVRGVKFPFVPVARAGGGVVTEDPDGVLHGHGPVIASADASRVRPQDCTPRLRQILFGSRS